MDSDRKYRQHGYSENTSLPGGNGFPKPKPAGPRPSLDITGPRLPRLVQAVTASRCYSCSTTLPPGTDFTGPCPKCAAALHCCKQCSHFEPSTRFQCMKPVPVRIPIKDKQNECTLFSPRVTVAREMTSAQNGNVNGSGYGNGFGNNAQRLPPPGANTPPPRSAADARDAFDRLFKK